jgi:hypothetical protein
LHSANQYSKQRAFAPFQDGDFYTSKELEAKGIAKQQTFAQWRHLKKGPPYIKVGSRVLYPGVDLLAWLEAQRVETLAA